MLLLNSPPTRCLLFSILRPKHNFIFLVSFWIMFFHALLNTVANWLLFSFQMSKFDSSTTSVTNIKILHLLLYRAPYNFGFLWLGALCVGKSGIKDYLVSFLANAMSQLKQSHWFFFTHRGLQWIKLFPELSYVFERTMLFLQVFFLRKFFQYWMKVSSYVF